MNNYYYVVNTFKELNDGKLYPIQIDGYGFGINEQDIINNLIIKNIIYSKGYEFLEICKCEDK